MRPDPPLVRDVDLFPWWPWDVGSVTDLVSIGLGLVVLALTLYVALRQLRIMNYQTKLAEEQTAMAKRLERITVRQGEIAERQHQAFEAQQALRTDLRFIAPTQHWGGVIPGNPQTEVILVVHNGGSKASNGFYWEVMISRDLRVPVHFEDLAGNRLETQFAPITATEHYDKVDGHYNQRLSPFSGIRLVKMVVATSSPRARQSVIRWRIRTDEGLVPPQGLAEMGFFQEPDGTFAVQTPFPGEAVDPNAPTVRQGEQ